jgi:8-oxo-dGTP pyrophosphatase MutT (NUDIX family)
MARRRDQPPRGVTSAAPPVRREFSAGGLVHRRRGDAVLVVLAGRRHAESGALVWGLPKGHVEPGETAPDAAVREVREETGIRAEIEAPLGDVAYWFVKRAASGPVRVSKRVRFFLMAARGGRFADRDDELDAVRWAPLDEAERRLVYANERALLARARTLLAAR